jgi:DNA excision repair protein ERCC-3
VEQEIQTGHSHGPAGHSPGLARVYRQGESLEIVFRQQSLGGGPFGLRQYHQEAADIFHAAGAARGGSGVIVLPCGAGKTIVGLACTAKLQTSTLILTTNVTATRQWVSEVLDKTTLGEDQIGQYNGSRNDVLPVTVATYNIMTWRKSKDAPYKHLDLFDQRDWGLIIYDEVHLLPAPVFQVTAGLQARRRLGLTATLVREDRREDDVFALIGPKKVDVVWSRN